MPQPVRRGPLLVCPKSGRPLGLRPGSWLLRVPLPLVGLAALAWYLVRVLPKPSRAAYPCQRAAVPLALGFLGYLASLTAAGLALRGARRRLWESRYGAAAACASVGVAAAFLSLRSASTETKAGVDRAVAWTPADPPNRPIGVARGIHPGRVAWVRDPSAVLWDGGTGHWWDDHATDQARVDAMTSRAVRVLTGAGDDKAAWDALFRSHNKAHAKADRGYARGQAVAIKINQNTARDGHERNGNPRNENSINGNPHLILSLLRQLVRAAGVAQEDIYVYDISRYIGDNIFRPSHAEFPRVHFVEVEKGGGEGREAAPPERDWAKGTIAYSDPSRGLGRQLPPVVLKASYLINMAIMKNHGDVGPTLLAKNHFGTVHGINHGVIAPRRMGESNPLVDLLAHKDVGEKTMLFMIDTLYAADGPDATPRRWKLAPFGTPEAPGWPASLLVSQDGVALDSVGFDFVNAEWGVAPFTDNFLHEAALAADPPSGKRYGPVSLGVHEHWNNPLDMKYSRNLGTGKGIELVPVFFPAAPSAVVVTPAKGRVTLKWSATAGAARYNVKRATEGGGPYATITSTDANHYTDSGVVNGRSYYYVISTANSLGESRDSSEVGARPGAFVAAVNAGGRASAQFAADANYLGGTTSSTTNPIDTAGLAGPAPREVYQTDRWGHDFSYAFTGLMPRAEYTVRLHFAEFHFGDAGQRVFNVAINGTSVLKDFDIIDATHAKNRATIREFKARADDGGRIDIKFSAVKDNPKCSGIEILEAAP